MDSLSFDKALGGSLERSASQSIGLTGAQNLDWGAGNYADLTAPIGNVTISFTNMPAAALGQTMLVVFTQHGTTPRTVTWPSSVKVAGGGGLVVSTTAGAKDLIALTSIDGGTTVLASIQKAFA